MQAIFTEVVMVVINHERELKIHHIKAGTSGKQVPDLLYSKGKSLALPQDMISGF